jgi:hypothetical protein
VNSSQTLLPITLARCQYPRPHGSEWIKDVNVLEGISRDLMDILYLKLPGETEKPLQISVRSSVMPANCKTKAEYLWNKKLACVEVLYPRLIHVTYGYLTNGLNRLTGQIQKILSDTDNLLLWHVDPLLDNDREISYCTRYVAG